MEIGNGWKHFAVLAVALLVLGCGARRASDTNAFLLRRDDPDVQEASAQAVRALAQEIEARGELQAGYPLVGQVATAPDPDDPKVQRMTCAAEGAADSRVVPCILLNQGGDFVRVQPITWQSAAFFMFRIYVLPRSLFARVDPSRDFVAIDVYLQQEPALWETVAQAIGDAAGRLGARPYRP